MSKNLTELERRVLATMAERPGSWLGLIAQAMGLATVEILSPALRLEDWGLIRRVDEVTDVKRKWDVTAGGRAALAPAAPDRWAAYLQSQIAYHEGTYQEALRRGDGAAADRCAARARAVTMVAEAWRTGGY